ncbi:rho guanine nucleotide exchange factor 16 [Hippocampus zosterae]|uniref:rho guanine nucleotide exchange factor 16 n=1 Tax=Hippocampus zosterae TaxID=109293 RepID=UPI00223D58FA|nr:rho guanine nucleotide exchange factor 16 [Hippocampus zosterae]
MSRTQSEGRVGDRSPLILESRFSTELNISEPSDECYQSQSSPTVQAEAPTVQEDTVDRLVVPQQLILSTQSAAALKLGTQQIIPKNLAVACRPKNRHHTTVVTFPVGLENSSHGSRIRHSAQGADVSWEDYDSDGDGFALRRNRRNKSYRAAVTSLDIEAMARGKGAVNALKPVKEGRGSSPGSGRSPVRKRTLGRKRNRNNQRGSFKDATPRLYQEIRERGLHSTNQDELLDDFVVVEAPVEDQSIVVKSYRPAQLTWSQLPQVKDTGILGMISPQERKRQEAIFEIITSEHSYLHSLGILVRHFKESEPLRKTMTATEHHHLFSNISVIHQVSKRFFEDLERRHNYNPVIRDISDIVQNHAAHHFEPYIVYCSNETFQQRTLQKLLSTNGAFKDTLKQIEASGDCGGLPMISFLILPMQRVTRLPLLLDTICQKTPDKTAEYFAAIWALHAISKLVGSCNDGARRMERTEQMFTIQKQMEFGKIKPFPLVSSSRWLKKRGELAVCAEELSIWRAFSNRSNYLFLFNDVLIVTKKKSEESFVVIDYATLDHVEVEVSEEFDGQASPPAKNSSSQYLSFKLLMSKNSEGRPERTTLVAESRVDRARWIVALTEHKQTELFSRKEGLPQYEAAKAYIPKEPDEVGLQQAELVIVQRKEEGWCYGERMRDGERGWFPASCATEITNPTAIEDNMQRMKRLRQESNV